MSSEESAIIRHIYLSDNDSSEVFTNNGPSDFTTILPIPLDNRKDDLELALTSLQGILNVSELRNHEVLLTFGDALLLASDTLPNREYSSVQEYVIGFNEMLVQFGSDASSSYVTDDFGEFNPLRMAYDGVTVTFLLETGGKYAAVWVEKGVPEIEMYVSSALADVLGFPRDTTLTPGMTSIYNPYRLMLGTHVAVQCDLVRSTIVGGTLQPIIGVMLLSSGKDNDNPVIEYTPPMNRYHELSQAYADSIRIRLSDLEGRPFLYLMDRLVIGIAIRRKAI